MEFDLEVYLFDDVVYFVFIDVVGVFSLVSLDFVEFEEVSCCFFWVVYVVGGYWFVGDDDFIVNVWFGYFFVIVLDGSGDVGFVVVDW